MLLDYGAMRGIPFVCLRTDYGRSLVVSYGIANSGMLLPVTFSSSRCMIVVKGVPYRGECKRHNWAVYHKTSAFIIGGG